MLSLIFKFFYDIFVKHYIGGGCGFKIKLMYNSYGFLTLSLNKFNKSGTSWKPYTGTHYEILFLY